MTQSLLAYLGERGDLGDLGVALSYFSDSFYSNQKGSPHKIPIDNRYIDIIEERSLSVINSERSK